jgi:NAD+ synthase (glutamine-hydrolysing)
VCSSDLAGRAVIPEATLTKAPSAELRPDQVDQDSLPPYELLDEVLELYIVKNLGAAEIVGRGYDPSLVERIITMVGRAEYKRRQAAPVIKVSSRVFGMGRRMPIARAIYEALG